MLPVSQRIYDAIVVGGGHNGLTAAAYLARAGLSDAGAGAARNCWRVLRDGRDCAGLPRFDDFLYCEHVAAGSDSRFAACRVWTAHGALRSGDAGGVSGWARGAVVGEPRAGEGGVRKISARDAEQFVRVDDQLKKLARYLQPFFMEPPPEIDTRSIGGWSDLFRVGKRFRGISK